MTPGALPSPAAVPGTSDPPGRAPADAATTDAVAAEAVATGRRWWLWLGLICVGALALRVGYVLALRDTTHVAGDAYQYHYGANLLVDGKGFVAAPVPFHSGGRLPQTAQHPPLYSMVLAIASAVGLRSVLDHLLWSCAMGTASVAVMGTVGRRVAGPRAGLVAAAIVAVYPNAWIFDGLLAAETLSLLTVALTLAAAYRFWQRHSLRHAIELGVACALAALTRGEGILLLPLVALPLVALAGPPDRRRRLGLAVVTTLATAAALAPWVGFNLRRFDRPVLGTSTGFDLVLVSANCHAPYYGPGVGYWNFFCIPHPPAAGDESDASAYYRRVAVDYMDSHRSRLAEVVAARIGRTWGLYQPLGQVGLDAYFESRPLAFARVGLAMYYALAVASVFGAVRLRRRRVPLSPLVGTVVLVTVTVVVTYGTTRFRVTAEPALILLGAVAVDGGLERLVAFGRRRAGGRDRPKWGVMAGPE